MKKKSGLDFWGKVEVDVDILPGKVQKSVLTFSDIYSSLMNREKHCRKHWDVAVAGDEYVPRLPRHG